MEISIQKFSFQAFAEKISGKMIPFSADGLFPRGAHGRVRFFKFVLPLEPGLLLGVRPLFGTRADQSFR